MKNIIIDDELSKFFFKKLALEVVKINPKKRFCAFVFYNSKMVNVEQNDEETEELLEETIMTFLVVGLDEKFWSQPVLTLCWKKRYTPDILASFVKTIIQLVFETGLNVVASVSDHNSYSRQAIAHLIAESKYNLDNGECYNINGNKIYHLYDPCRLIKSFRNAFLNNTVMFQMDGVRKIADWNYIVMSHIHNIAKDKDNADFLSRSIYACSFNKNNTSHATRVLCETIGKFIIENAQSGKFFPQAKETGELLLFIDKLFDTCNSSEYFDYKIKSHRKDLTVDSPHYPFWTKAIEVLDSMYFVKKDKKVFRPDCLEKWAMTLRGLQSVWKTLRKAKVKSLSTRRFNLDTITYFCELLRLLSGLGYYQRNEPCTTMFLSIELLKLIINRGPCNIDNLIEMVSSDAADNE